MIQGAIFDWLLNKFKLTIKPVEDQMLDFSIFVYVLHLFSSVEIKKPIIM